MENLYHLIFYETLDNIMLPCNKMTRNAGYRNDKVSSVFLESLNYLRLLTGGKTC